MTANILAGGVDLDTVFASHVTNNATNAIGYQVASVDVQTRFDPLSGPAIQNAGARIPAINIKTSATGWSANTDLASIFCGNASQYSLTSTSATSNSGGGWSSPKQWTHQISVLFSNAAALTNYFFYGGRIQISPSQTAGTAADNSLAAMFAGVGTIIIYDAGHYRTGSGGIITNAGIGGANVGTVTVPLFNTTGASPYSDIIYDVNMNANGAVGVATQLFITAFMNTPTVQPGVDVYTGTYTSSVQQRNHPSQSVPTVFGTLYST